MPEEIVNTSSDLTDVVESKVKPDFDEIITLSNLYETGIQSCSGLRWKPSVTRFEDVCASQMCYVIKQIENGTYRQSPFNQFKLNERGKTRSIAALRPEDRVIQKVFNRDVLLPMIQPSLIKNNSASIKGKGMDYAIKTFKSQLRDHYKEYGLQGGIYQFDFSKYFESIPHKMIKEKIIKPLQLDGRLESVLCNFVNDFRKLEGAKERKDEYGWRGIGLGSEVSQTIALDSATFLDKYITVVLKKDKYGRYMDDGYVISNDLDELEKIRENAHKIVDSFGLHLNDKKDRITPFESQKFFVFLKNKYRILPNGKIIMKPVKSNLKIINKRMKKWRQKLNEGKMTIEDICNSYNGWRASILRCDNIYITIYNKDLQFVKEFRNELRHFQRPFKCYIKCIKTSNGYEYITKPLKDSKLNKQNHNQYYRNMIKNQQRSN